MTQFGDMKRTKKRKDGWPRIITVGRVNVSVTRDFLPSGNPRYRVDGRPFGAGQPPYKTEALALEAAQRLANRISTGETKAALLTEKQAMEYILSADALKPFNLTVGDVSAWMAQALTKVSDIHNLNEALNFYAARHKKITDKSAKEVGDALVADKKKKKYSLRYVQSLNSCFTRFAKHFVGNIGAVTTPMLKAWLDSLDIEPQTYVNNRTMLNVLFEYAVECGHAIDNPIAGIKSPRLKGRPTEIYTPEEITKLLNVASSELLPCVAIGAFAGLRSAEIQRLEWSDIDLTRRIIKVKPLTAKTGSRRNVPVSDNLLAWLADFKDSKGLLWKGTYFGYYRAQAELGTDAGVEWVHNGLRHSFGSYRLAQLQDDAKTSFEMGNTPKTVHQYYKEVVTPEEATSYFAVRPEQAANIVSLAKRA
jgi:integrase